MKKVNDMNIEELKKKDSFKFYNIRRILQLRYEKN